MTARRYDCNRRVDKPLLLAILLVVPTEQQQAAGIRVPSRNSTGVIVPPVPKFPEDLLARFPSLRATQSQWEKWAADLAVSIRNGI